LVNLFELKMKVGSHYYQRGWLAVGCTVHKIVPYVLEIKESGGHEGQFRD